MQGQTARPTVRPMRKVLIAPLSCSSQRPFQHLHFQALHVICKRLIGRPIRLTNVSSVMVEMISASFFRRRRPTASRQCFQRALSEGF